jgi:transposase
MNVRYRVELSQAERGELTAMLSKGKRAARKLKRAQILLAADAGCSDDEIARTVAVSGSTVYRTKRRFVEGNLERALSEEPRPGAGRKLSGKEEALLVASPGAGICGAFPGSTASMSPAWKTCSTSMPRRPIPAGRWCASTKARFS